MNILDTIAAQKRLEIARLPDRPANAAALRQAIDARGGLRGFIPALRHPAHGRMALIAEVKKASPSAGIIQPDFDPARIARAYETAGASCISVLTDETFFQGSLADLRAVRETVSLPLLRKDFVLDPRQLLEAVENGADAVLLIVAMLGDGELRALHDLAVSAGLDALVEVHDEVEFDRAMAVGARLIGINNRNLKTFKVDLGTTERLAARLAATNDILLVAESGIHTRADVLRVEQSGAQAILVGESLMRGSNPAQKAAELLGEKPAPSL